MAWHQTSDKPLPELMLAQLTDTYWTLVGDKSINWTTADLFRVAGSV